MDPITAAYSSLKFAKDALTVTLGYKIEIETRGRIAAALEKLGDVQDKLFDLREEIARLQDEKERLSKELKTKNEWENRRENYKLEQTPGGAIVYLFTGEPKHYVCPSCFSKNEIEILQDHRGRDGMFICSGCKTSFPVKPYQPITMDIETPMRRSVFDDW